MNGTEILPNTFLNTHGRTLVFTIDLVVLTTEYRIDRILFLEQRIPEENLYRKKHGKDVLTYDKGLYIPLSSKKGFEGKLYLDIQAWK